MKGKTKKQLKRAVFYALIFIFIAGTLLLYLPLGQTASQATAPPLNQVPADQQNAPNVQVTGQPGQ